MDTTCLPTPDPPRPARWHPSSGPPMPAADPPAERRFETLLHEHRRIVMHIARAYAFGADDRRDLAQEIAMQAWRAFRSYDAARPFSTWLYRVALNTGLSHARRHVRDAGRTQPLDDELLATLPADSPAERDPRVALLHACIAELDPLDRALMLLWLEDCAYAEIADVLGLSATNVATKLNRLKARLARRMTSEGA